jgi:protein-tyrosine phosphatase
LFYLSCTSSVFARVDDNCSGTIEHPCVVQDNDDNTPTLKHWRTAAMMHDAYTGNTDGLSNLRASASGAPTANGFITIVNHIKKESNDKHTKMMMIDLREESHAYLNHNAITLTVLHNWINLGKTHQQSLSDEMLWLQSLITQSYISNVLTTDQFKSGRYENGINIKLLTLESERDVAEKAGFEYIRFTISDHMAPRDEEIDSIVNVLKNIPANTWVHFHCRAGDGRSSTAFVMYDMLRHADKVSFSDIIKRQASVFPYYDLSQTERKDPELTEYYKARLVFLNHFYQYANAFLHGYRGNWSDWKRSNETMH